jgi:spore coat polysaccharide biosynthesis predicted glycosyltransferase SpsG
VYVRADANRTLGWGHVIRSGALAEELGRSGYPVTFLIRESDPAAVAYLRSRFRVRGLRRELGAGDAAPVPRGSWLVLDRYGFGAEDHLALRAQGCKVLAVDDEGRGTFAPDVLLNQNAGAERIRYKTVGRPRLLLGPRFVLLRGEFSAPRRGRRRAKESGLKVLLTFGGGDLSVLSGRVRALLDPLLRGGMVRIVVGPSAVDPRGVARREVVRGASAAGMRELMDWCDAAVTAAGSTCWELASRGVPMAVLTCARNQEPVAKALARRGAAFSLGWPERLSDATLSRRLARFLGDAPRRRRLGLRAARLVDGKGVERVIAAMGL